MKCGKCGRAFNQITWCEDCRKSEPPVAGSATGSANSSAAKETLKKEIARIIDAAFTAGFDAENASALDHFDGFALADAAIEQSWPNDQAERPAGGKHEA